MVRLTRLKIDRFRNVKPGTDLRFGPTFNVLLGKNATGKSTLLDLIAAVTNDDLSGFADEEAGFDLTWWLEEDGHVLEAHGCRTPVKARPQPDRVRESREFDDSLTITLLKSGLLTSRFEVKGTRGTWMPAGRAQESFDVRAGLSVSGTAERALRAVYDNYSVLFQADPASDVGDAIGHFVADTGQVGRFDEALSSLDAITHATFIVNKQGIEGDERWLPMEFLFSLEEPDPLEPFVLSFAKLHELSSVPQILGFASGEIRARLWQQTLGGVGGVRAIYQGFDCIFQQDDGSQISHQLLSFGQKRLFAFLWYLAVRRFLPVVADELLNGLHHEWISICFDRLQDRQSFLATQHPFLLDHVPIETAAAVCTTFVRCTVETGSDGRKRMAWRNFTEEEADRFFVAYQTGIQHVSEVLRSEGLW
jgi:hypothetical protein